MEEHQSRKGKTSLGKSVAGGAMNIGSRKPSQQELKLLDLLVSRSSNRVLPANWKSNLLVRQMDDGGMGSLRLIPKEIDDFNRLFGIQVSEYRFFDIDGIEIVASLNLDEAGYLFELDMWKTNFKPLIEIRI